MNNRTKLLTAAGTVVLLSGIGGALALWADGAQGANLWTNGGHLEVDLLDASTKVYDISEFCSPSAAAANAAAALLEEGQDLDPEDFIDLEISVDCSTEPKLMDRDSTGQALKPGEGKAGEWYMVPGDTIRIIAPITVDLEGQNILAKLTTELLDAEAWEGPTGAYSWADVSSTGIKPSQFEVTPVGIFADAKWTVPLIAEATSDDSDAGGTYYFDSSMSGPTGVYVAVDVHFKNLGGLEIVWENGEGKVKAGSGDYQDADGWNVTHKESDVAAEKDYRGDDLMGAKVWPLLHGIKAELVQVSTAKQDTAPVAP